MRDAGIWQGRRSVKPSLERREERRAKKAFLDRQGPCAKREIYGERIINSQICFAERKEYQV